MRGPFAELAEVAGRADDPRAEVMLPDPVDHHAGRQRVFGRASHRASSSRPLPVGDRLAANRSARITGKWRGTRSPEPGVAAADVHVDVVNPGVRAAGHASFLSAVGIRDRRRRVLLQACRDRSEGA